MLIRGQARATEWPYGTRYIPVRVFECVPGKCVHNTDTNTERYGCGTVNGLQVETLCEMKIKHTIPGVYPTLNSRTGPHSTAVAADNNDIERKRTHTQTYAPQQQQLRYTKHQPYKPHKHDELHKTRRQNTQCCHGCYGGYGKLLMLMLSAMSIACTIHTQTLRRNWGWAVDGGGNFLIVQRTIQRALDKRATLSPHQKTRHNKATHALAAHFHA